MLTLSRSCCKALALGTGIYQKCCYPLYSGFRFSSSSKVLPLDLHEAYSRNFHPNAPANSSLFADRNSNRPRPRPTQPMKDSSRPTFSGDPDVFGTLSVSLKTADDETEFDDGDIMEKQHLENVPDRSKQLSTKQYADMIKAHLRNKNLTDAINVLQERMLKQDRVKPENYIYNLLIGACGRTGHAKQAFHLYNQMKKRSLKVTGGTYTALFNACATSFYPQDALKRANHLRQLMVEKNYQPNETNYHAMIKAYGRCGDLSTAFSLVDEMVEGKLMPSSDTFNFLLHACISDQEAGFRHALLVWRKMREHNIIPNAYTYNLILRVCRDCGLGDAQIANDLLQKLSSNSKQLLMSASGMEAGDQETNASVGTSNSLLPGLDDQQETQLHLKPESIVIKSASHHLKESTQQHGENVVVVAHPALLPTDTIDSNWPNLLAAKPCLGSITSVAELTSGPDHLLLLGGCSEFLKQMVHDNVKPNIKTFTQLLDLVPPTRAAEKELMQAMTRHGVQRDIDFYNMLIKKRSMQHDYDGAREVLSLITEARLKPDIITYGVLALSCNKKELARNLLEEIDQAGFRVNAEILGALLRQACYSWNFGYVLEMMETAKREEIEINAQFYQHLDKFYRRGRQVFYDKDCGRPVPRFMDSDYFNSGFKLFCLRYKNWLRETQKQPPDLERNSDDEHADRLYV